MARGGYQKPSNPTPVSLPGALASRTDGGPTDIPTYMPGMKSMGSTGREYMAQVQGASLRAKPASNGGMSSTMDNLPPVTAINAPTALPDQPIADGTSAFGGNDASALNLPKQEDTDIDKQRLMSYLPAFEAAANMPNASMAWKNYVRLVRSLT